MASWADIPDKFKSPGQWINFKAWLLLLEGDAFDKKSLLFMYAQTYDIKTTRDDVLLLTGIDE